MSRTYTFSFILAVATLSLLPFVCSSAFASPLSIPLDSIRSLVLPVVTIETVDGEEPTCERAVPPEEEGAVGMGITNVTKIPGHLVITLGGDTLYDSGPYVKDSTGMRVKIRGNSSAWTPKKPYKVKLERKADLLLRGDEERYADRDWVLLKDPLFRLHIGFETGRLIGMEWTPAHRYVNLVMNGDYRGLYLLCEPVERNTRCRIVTEKSGFIAESDPFWWLEPLSIPSSLMPHFRWTLKYPDSDDVTDEELSFITRELEGIEKAVRGTDYPSCIDVESWARWLLAHEILGTEDCYGSNIFVACNDSLGSKARMPVLWDFDSIFQMEDDWSNVHNHRFFFNRLLSSANGAFRQAYRTLWEETRRSVFDGILSYIDGYAISEEAGAVDAAMRLDADRWHSEYTSLRDHLDKARAWFNTREAWLEEHIATEVKEPYRILDIGNSYTDNYTAMLKGIAEGSGIDMEGISLYKLTRSSGSFKTWSDCYACLDTMPYRFSRVLGRQVVTPEGAAGPHDQSLLHKVLREQPWDLIVLHQRSEYAHLYDLWTGDGEGGHLDDLLAIIRREQPEAEIGFHIIHSYADWLTGIAGNGSLVRWQQIAESARRLAEDRDIDVIIPCGTAVESLREQPQGNPADYASDGSHLAAGLGQYTAACTYFEAVLAPLFGVTVLGNPARYTCSELELANAKYPEACVDVTDGNAPIAQQLAVDAVANPYSISTSGIEAVPCDRTETAGPAYNVWGIPVGDDYQGLRLQGGRKYLLVK
ncbi:MAG: CotH kinase family protein [Bacteroidales bacterium]|nr:CotH kinase family protein [Bacteroidales bacterium]